jgi:hypothetical protein
MVLSKLAMAFNEHIQNANSGTIHPLLTLAGRRHWGVIIAEFNQDFFIIEF